ncbi:hypothetical protein RB195_021080 [Necator americanus]|uniref:RNA polymerase II-associated factor 1 homolog n=1 Tax=Necator americanus TaxID=51031 RepID=A0ABR1E983_NECAM
MFAEKKVLGMSVTPPLSEQLPRTNKFIGESFAVSTNNRTIYAGSEEDTMKKESRVILLVGPQTSGKSSLIDFLCNYFYGADLEKTTRYHIANEKFDSTTPEKQIITYVFNDTKIDVRPVVIDTPSTNGANAEENREVIAKWLKDNEKLKIDAIGVVFSAYQRMSSSDEENLQKVLAIFPEQLRSKHIVFITGSDGSSPPVGMLRRFNLDRADVYKVNTSCIFQRPEDDPLQEHLRGNYWRMGVANFGALFSRLKYGASPSFIVCEYEPPTLLSPVSIHSSKSSQNSVETVIYRAPSGDVRETEKSTVYGSNVTTNIATNGVLSQKSPSSEEMVAIHHPQLVKGISERDSLKTGRNDGYMHHQTDKAIKVNYDSKSALEHVCNPRKDELTMRLNVAVLSDNDACKSGENESKPNEGCFDNREDLLKNLPGTPPSHRTQERSGSLPAYIAFECTSRPVRDTSKVSSAAPLADASSRQHQPVGTPSTPQTTHQVPTEVTPQQTPQVLSFSHQDCDTSLKAAKTQEPDHLGLAAIDYSFQSEAKMLASTSRVRAMSHTPHELQLCLRGEDMVRSAGRKPRETTIDDPYYPSTERIKEYASPFRHSWHEIHARPYSSRHCQPVLSEHKTFKETVIDFPSSPPVHSELSNMHGIDRRGFPSPRSRSVDRIDVTPGSDAVGISTSEYYISGGVPEPSYDRVSERKLLAKDDQKLLTKYSNTSSTEYDQVPLEVNLLDDNGAIHVGTAQPAYASIHKMSGSTSLARAEMAVQQRANVPEKTGTDKDRVSYSGYSRSFYDYASDASAGRNHEQVQDGAEKRNEFMIPAQMRSNKSPIVVHLHMAKTASEVESAPGQHNPLEYGDDWGEETTITRKVDDSHPCPQLIEERYHYRHYGDQRAEDTHNERAKWTADTPSPVPALPPPPQSTYFRGTHGASSEVEFGGGETLPLKEGKRSLATTKKIRTPRTFRHPGQIRSVNWSLVTCSSPRDCCLNILFCVLAPLIVLFIVVAIILTLLIG